VLFRSVDGSAQGYGAQKTDKSGEYEKAN